MREILSQGLSSRGEAMDGERRVWWLLLLHLDTEMEGEERAADKALNGATWHGNGGGMTSPESRGFPPCCHFF